ANIAYSGPTTTRAPPAAASPASLRSVWRFAGLSVCGANCATATVDCATKSDCTALRYWTVGRRCHIQALNSWSMSTNYDEDESSGRSAESTPVVSPTFADLGV